jgi:hypothetical protein
MPQEITNVLAFLETKASVLMTAYKGSKWTINVSKHGYKLQRQMSQKGSKVIADVEVFPYLLYQSVQPNARKRTIPLYVVAANGICLHPIQGGQVVATPRIHCPGLREAIVQAAFASAPSLLSEQKRAGGIEIAGDIVCNPKRVRGKWEVLFEICKDKLAGKYSSQPSCGRQRKCMGKRTLPNTFVDVGEFHTHPPTEDDTVCRTPSHFDVYQLLIGAHLRHHNFSITVCTEGVYVMTASTWAVERNTADIWSYYKMEELHGVPFSVTKTERAINTCRIPLVELLEKMKKVPQDVQYIHNVLVGLPNTFFHLLENKQEAPDRASFIRQYLEALHGLGINAEFHGYRSNR